MVEISKFYGISIMIPLGKSGEPSFVARYESYEATFDIEDGMFMGHFPRRGIVMIYEWLDLYQDDLKRVWRSIQEGEPIDVIDPLK